MEVHMVDLLMCRPSIVLQYIVVLCAGGFGYALGDLEDLGELVVGDVREFDTVVFGDD
jgi:hypothetical protein